MIDGHSRDLDALRPDMQIKAREVVRLCQQEGVDLLIYCTWRSAAEQARLYRRSRTWQQIQEKADLYLRDGYEGLAEILMAVGPQWGKLGEHVTHAGPGESWHQYGQAIDAVPITGGKPDWQAGSPAYRVYAACCREAGLQHASDWSGWTEWPHAQLPAGSNPLLSLRPNDPSILSLAA